MTNYPALIRQGVVLILCFIATGAMAQRTCGTNEVQQRMIQNDPSLAGNLAETERWVQQYLTTHPDAKTGSNHVTIPIVVHVVHNGEGIDTGANISDAQIHSQIQALNEDYRRINSDTGNTPGVFKPLAADMEIEFCLALNDPDGTPTTGIDRIDGNRATWTDVQIDNNLKPGSIWDRDYYLNIWTVKFSTTAGLLGYAIKPGNAADIDGVVIGYQYFGTVGNVIAPYNKGRTTTHEVGHWLGLDHVWSSFADPTTSSCIDDDGIADTPDSEKGHFGCPTFPFVSCGADSASGGDMFMNYMDYTDDACMNLFTLGQKAKVTSVLNTVRNVIKISNLCTSDVTASVNDVKTGKSFVVKPNPSTGCFTLARVNMGGEQGIVEVYNLMGEKVWEQVLYGQQAYMDMGRAAPGLYLVKVTAGKNIYTQKLIINR